MSEIKNNCVFRYVMTIGMILFFIGISSNLMAADEPKAEIKKDAYTFEEVIDGTLVKHAFVISNTGKAPLIIKSVQTSCGCTTAKKPEKIAPGQSDEIIVQGNTTGYGGHRFKKTISVVTNDPKQERILLKFEGPVARFAEISPTRISLFGVADEKISAEVAITPESKYPFKILSVEPDKNLKGKIELKLDRKEKSYTIKVLNKVSGSARYRGYITIKTDSKLRPELQLHVYAYIKPKAS